MRNPGGSTGDAADIGKPSRHKPHAHAKPWAWHPKFGHYGGCRALKAARETEFRERAFPNGVWERGLI